jgi:peptide/nickel transport system substrate-binding protein
MKTPALMKRFASRLLAAASLILAAGNHTHAATRPQYGGTLRIAVHDAPSSLDPMTLNDSPATSAIARLLFDTLVTIDASDRLKPGLAESWQTDAPHQRWTFTLRPGVTFANGTPVTPQIVAATLRTSNPDWNVSTSGDTTVVIQLAAPVWSLPATLALTRNAVADRSGTTAVGSGPYQVTEWRPGRNLTLAARDDYWAGRSFIDSVQIQFGLSSREQLASIDSRKSDLAPLPPQIAKQLSSQGKAVTITAPVELLALVWNRASQSPDEMKLLEVLTLSIDRNSIKDVLLRGQAEAAGGILPQWLSGYEFLFSTGVDLPKASLLRRQLKSSGPWSLGYDSSDPSNQLIAERIALNARDGGVLLQPTSSPDADLRLTRVHLCSPDPAVALIELSRALSLPPPRITDSSIDAIYEAELALLQTRRIVPIVHVPVAYLTGTSLKDLRTQPDGTWDTNSLWLKQGNP